MLNPVYRAESCGPPIYDPGEDYFTLKMWWKGELKQNVYTSTEAGLFDWCHAENLSLKLMDTWLNQFGFEGGVRYVYSIENGSEKALKNLNKESDLFEMCMDIGENKYVDVFVLHDEERVLLVNGERGRCSEERKDDHDAEMSENTEVQVHVKVYGEMCEEGTNIGNEERCEGVSVVVEEEEEFNIQRDCFDPSFEVSMLFGNFKEFKTAVKNWSIKNRFGVRFEANDFERCIITCPNDSEEQPCKFRIYAAKVNRQDPKDHSVQIRVLNLKHICSKVFKNRFVNSEWLAKKYYEQFREDIDWSLNGIMDAVQRDTTYTITRQVAYRAKDLARKWIQWEEKEQYSKILNYQRDIEQTNPGSTVQVRRDMGVVIGFYMCLNPLKEGFKKSGRPLICLDGCFLKGTYGGQLLSAVTIDPNDCIYPIAWAVVTTESTDTWTWFLDLLGQDLNLFNDSRITFMSDRQKGLIRAVHDLFPEAEHRHCVRHIYTNFRERFKGKTLKDLLWNCARASYVQRFDKALEALKVENIDAYEWLLHPDRPSCSWTRAYFRTHTNCDMLLNNLCECFNKYILDARGFPIISLNEAVKVKIMRRVKKKKDQMEKYKGKICPKVQGKLNKLIDIVAHYKPEFSGGPRVSVTTPGGPYIVNLQEKTCTCRRWQLTGLPCSHAICSIRHNNQRVEDFVFEYYYVSTFMEMYSNYINPTNNEELCPEVENPGWLIPPPEIKRKRGRKEMSRRKEPEEIERAKATKKNPNKQSVENDILDVGVPKKLSKRGLVKMRCSVCGKEGHNKR